MSYRPYPWHTDVIVDVNFHFRVWISINTNIQHVHHEYLTFLINFAISISRHISYFYHIFHIFRTMMILPSFHIFHIFRNMMILPSFHIFHIFSEYDDIAKFPYFFIFFGIWWYCQVSWCWSSPWWTTSATCREMYQYKWEFVLPASLRRLRP